MKHFMGIDGGGSNLRVVIVNDDMQPIAQVQDGTANPSSIGREAASQRIRDTMWTALQQADKPPIAGVGIGIAGASAAYAAEWLREVAAAALPDAFIAPSSDNEIALVGARGERFGGLLLAGTGSVAYGIDVDGHCTQVGGWGYLLGDEGSGFWLGMEALRTLVREADGTQPSLSALTPRLYDALSITNAQDAINWLYHPLEVAKVARLARIVIETAEKGDWRAVEIVAEASRHLALLAHTLMTRTGLRTEHLVFAGGLLSADNLLSQRTRAHLGLSEQPTALYPPVIGAALLAKLTLHTP